MLQLVKKPPIKRWILTLVFVVFLGVFGYMIIDGFNFLDALYMAMVTITTIGYHEIRPLSEQGKVFNVIFIITSFSTISFLLAKLTQYVVSGDLSQYFKYKRIMQALEQKDNHVIICGFGRNGQQAAKTLKVHKMDYVVIEKDPETMEHYRQHDPDVTYLLGDATEDETLVKAGVQRAKAILVTLPEDADNVFIVLSARSLNPNLQIVGRASHQSATAKLYKAGANNVIMPDMIGGTHMATLVSKPDVIEFIDFLSGEEGEAIHIEAVNYDQLPPHVRDKSLLEVMNWKKTGVNCIGVKDELGRFNINPPDSTIITYGMKVIVLGTREQIAQMKKNVGE